jgi:ATP-binding cassette, subfamily B, multidrug efflux pump
MARNKFDVDEALGEEFNAAQLRRMFRYVRPHLKSILFVVFMMILTTTAVFLGPTLMAVMVDKAIPARDLNLVFMLSGAFAAIFLFNSLVLKQRIRIMNEVAQRIIKTLRRDLFVHLQKLPFAFYDSRPHGKILIRVVNYVNSLNDLLQNGIINLITDLFSLVVITVYLFVLNPKLTLYSMVGLPVLVLVLYLLKNAQRIRWQMVSRKQSNMNAYLAETLTGIKVTQSFAREKENKRIFKSQSAENVAAWMKAVRINNLLWPISENISVISISVMYVIGVSMISGGEASIGVLIAFASYISMFWMPIMNIGNFYNQILVSAAYMERIFETMDEKVGIEDSPGAVPIPEIRGAIDFSHVNFSYEAGQPILKDVSFKVEPGETIALVGATGSGKTTIVSLISRFYDIQDGTIRVDGADISKVTIESLRSQMGVMMQDSFIFSGTVLENIRYGNLDATDEACIEAAKTVMAHEFIMELENGYATEVNERGSRLSVGQRQLISFARALLADPRILILDEATSSIDTRTEKALQKGLARLLHGRTSFVIAHRLSTIRNADRIFYIDDGRIIESGSHSELMHLGGAYHQLYTAQYAML